MLILVLILDFAAISGLVWGMVHFDRGAKEPVWLIVTLCCLGLPAGIVAYIAEYYLLSVQIHLPVLTSLLTFYGVGIIEESVKILPVLFLVWKRPFLRDHTDGVIYFAIAGQSFSLIEDLLYLLGQGTSVGLVRSLLDPFFHATTCAIFGYFVARYKVTGSSLGSVILAFIGAISLHALYDFFLTNPNLGFIGTLLGLSSYGLIFVVFFQARKADQRLGLAWIRTNRFCHNCGHPNPKRLLYCTACGVKTG